MNEGVESFRENCKQQGGDVRVLPQITLDRTLGLWRVSSLDIAENALGPALHERRGAFYKYIKPRMQTQKARLAHTQTSTSSKMLRSLDVSGNEVPGRLSSLGVRLSGSAGSLCEIHSRTRLRVCRIFFTNPLDC